MSKNKYEVNHCSECGRMVGDNEKICDECADSVASTKHNDRVHPDDPAGTLFTNG